MGKDRHMKDLVVALLAVEETLDQLGPDVLTSAAVTRLEIGMSDAKLEALERLGLLPLLHAERASLKEAMQ